MTMRSVAFVTLICVSAGLLSGCDYWFKECEDKNNNDKCDASENSKSNGPSNPGREFVAFTHHCANRNGNPSGRQCNRKVEASTCEQARSDYEREVRNADPCYRCTSGETWPDEHTFKVETWALQGRCNP